MGPSGQPCPHVQGEFWGLVLCRGGEVFQGGVPLLAQPSPTGLTAVIPEGRKICACFSAAAAEQLRNVSHHGEPE